MRSERFPGLRRSIAISVLAVSAVSALAAEEMNWPQFRGPSGDGISASPALPLHWSEQDKVRWKTPIHGRAWSSPVIWETNIWLTTATEDGRNLFVICIEDRTGKVVQDLKLFEVEKPQYAHPFNTYASPTPVIESGRLYVTFGSPGTACLDTSNGKLLWSRRDFECNHYRGAGSSPILYGDMVIMNFDGSDRQYLVALDKRTGRTIWQANRSIDFQDLGQNGKPESEGDLRKAFATCHVALFDGTPTLLSQGSRALYAYVPATGEELWRVEERTSYSACTRPVVGLGLIFVPSGFASGRVLAIRPGKKGDQLDAKAPAVPGTQLQVVWQDKHNAPKKPSLLLLGDLLYAIEDNGLFTCWEARTGEVVWTHRLSGHYSASPLAGAGRIYVFSEDGKTSVMSAGREYNLLAENQLDDGFMASPAVSLKALYLRTKSALYRIEE